ATDIPEDKYGFAPAPGMRTVAQLLAHITQVSRFNEDVHRVRRLHTIEGYDFNALHKATAADAQALTTKSALLAALHAEGEKFATWLESLSDAFLAERVTNYDGKGSKSRLEMLLSPKEHEMHHRGQLMVVQRMLGIVPHLTRERDARAAQAAAQASAAASA
ncbi:MAG TPA: DinB family protein, partial [Gemmatimonadaceae bacterium]|nr:DinB family protein [Gemmatimonadaceae bacterium]